MEHTRNPERIYIFDTTDRDGEQATEGPVNGNESKLEIALKLGEARVDRIEAGFPVSSPDEFEAVQTIARNVGGSMIFALARVPFADVGVKTYEDIDVAYDAVQDAEYRGIHVFSIMFDPTSLGVYGVDKDTVIEWAERGVSHARRLLGDKGQVEFSFQNATNSPTEWVVEGYKRMINAGANVINVPDTVGYSYPEDISGLIGLLRGEIPDDAMISIHCHNDLGFAVPNSLAAVRAGADIIECTVNGVGERAGNAALEEVVMNIKTRPDKYDGRDVNVVTELLGPLSSLVSHHLGMDVQENKPIVGANAFRHRSGIHQAGMIKGGVYEIMNPESVGWIGETYDLTARSGYRGVGLRLRRLGYDVDDTDVKGSIMPDFIELADRKGRLDDLDLAVLYDRTLGTGFKDYEFVSLAIRKEESGSYRAKVTLRINGVEVHSKELNGNGIVDDNGSDESQGAIDAIFTAIDSVVEPDNTYRLIHYDPVNIGTGSDSTAEATVILGKNEEYGGRLRPTEYMVVGRSEHQDTLEASARAYVDVLRKI
tara:strand:- start:35040 stop:36659 length:1620 start_codon:yes stop_codon:yes gene_type:complete